VRRRRDVSGRDLTDPGHRAENHVQLPGKDVKFLFGHGETR